MGGLGEQRQCGVRVAGQRKARLGRAEKAKRTVARTRGTLALISSCADEGAIEGFRAWEGGAQSVSGLSVGTGEGWKG